MPDLGFVIRALALVVVLGGGYAQAEDGKATAKVPAAAKAPAKPPVKTRIQGATQMFSAPWGLAAQGSGQLRILPAGKSQWTVVHHVKGDSLYRIAFDDQGRLMATWENQDHFHLFVPSKKQHVTFKKPAAPSPDFKYGFSIEDLFFSKDGTAAIVYMHGFLGGRIWGTVAYHYALDRPTAEPTLLYRQDGYAMHTTSRLAVYALPKNAADACEDNSCYPLGSITAWEITGAKAKKIVLLNPDAKNQLSRVELMSGSDDDRVAIQITEHPKKRHVLLWKIGDAKADFRPLADGPDFHTSAMHWMKNGDVVEIWLTGEERGLLIKRIPPKGDEKLTKLAPLPKRTPRDHPLFDVSYAVERTNGDLSFRWGEYLLLLAPDGSAQRVDMRSLFKGNQEVSTRVIYVPDPEAFWIGSSVGRTEDFVYLTIADFQKRATKLAP